MSITVKYITTPTRIAPKKPTTDTKTLMRYIEIRLLAALAVFHLLLQQCSFQSNLSNSVKFVARVKTATTTKAQQK